MVDRRLSRQVIFLSLGPGRSGTGGASP